MTRRARIAVLTASPLVAALLVAAVAAPAAGRAAVTAPAAGRAAARPPGGLAVAAAVVPPVDGPVVRLFDPPDGPYGPGHRGVDLAAAPGGPVRVALGGTVGFAGTVAGARWVTVDHGNGLATTYGVLTELAVRAGQRVDAGDVLGRLGARGHVDWGARLDGRYIDPLALLGTWRVHLVR